MTWCDLSLHAKLSLPNRKVPFRAYPLDWRFLPEPALVVKDTLRYHALQTVRTAMNIKLLRLAIVKAGQARILGPAQRAGCLFIHIPKTGGTSISSCLYARNQPHLKAQFIFDLYGDLALSLPSFSVVRNPLDRLKSAYQFLRGGGTPLMAASRYEMKQVDCTSFAAFVDSMHDGPDITGRMLTLSTQSSFVCDQNGRVIVDRLFRMTAEGFSPRLIDWLGLSEIPRLNASVCNIASVNVDTQRKVELLYAADYDLYESSSIEH